MFAVILLGIGFIMLAGMFPVAIQQTQTNVEESTAANVARAAAHYMEESLTEADVPPTGILNPTAPIYPRFLRLTERCYASGPNQGKLINIITPSDPAGYILWEKLKGGFIFPQDSRYAWTALYKRNPGDNFAQVIIFALQARNYQNYTPLDLDVPPSASAAPFPLATIEPRYLPAYLSAGKNPGDPDLIEFFANTPVDTGIRDGVGGPANDDGALTEGCFVVVADDMVTADDGGTPWFDPGYANGRIYRVGIRRRDLDGTNGGNTKAYELMPGHDMKSAEENLPLRNSPHGSASTGLTDHKGGVPAFVYIIGRGFTNPSQGDYTISGFPQDIAVYTTFIRLK
jgi:hypothetical protein